MKKSTIGRARRRVFEKVFRAKVALAALKGDKTLWELASPVSRCPKTEGEPMKLAVGIWAIAVVAMTSVFAHGQTQLKAYDVEIDGQVFQIPAGEEKTVALQSGQELRIRVREKSIQKYEMGPLAFNYDTGCSLKDDGDEEQRQVVLIHASGCSVTITDHGPAAESDEAQLLSATVTNLEAAVRRGVARDLKKTKARSCDFPSSKGRMIAMSYLDEDNDHCIYAIHILQSGSRMFSVICSYDNEDPEIAKKLFDVVLNSIASAD